jgi:predicted metal-dependent phosphotriesterase family hydrolase
MATGHNSAEEDLMLIKEARAQGVKHIVVTHAMVEPIHMSVAQMQQAAKVGAYIEFTYNGTIGKNKEFSVADYAKAIRAVGVDHCILSSDMGQPGNPLHPDALVSFIKEMRQQGFTQQDINTMLKTNPALLIGLEP